MQRLTIPTILITLLIGLSAPGGALAQQSSSAPPSPIRQIQTRFELVDAPTHFDQVLHVVDFPAGGTWTPLHTSGGYVYTTVIAGVISTRGSWSEGVDQATAYEAGQTFVERPGEYLQVGNTSASDTRIMTTAVLPDRAPLTIYQDGFTSSAYPTLTDWNYTHDMMFSLPGPDTVYRSAIAVDRPEGGFQLVQFVLDLGALQPAGSAPAEGNTTSDDIGESCLNAWRRASNDMQLDVQQLNFQRVAANLCVSSAYVPLSLAPGREP